MNFQLSSVEILNATFHNLQRSLLEEAISGIAAGATGPPHFGIGQN